MLRGLDELRKCSNVIFFSTSNFISNIDSAFVDRIVLKRFINAPTANCAYEIFRLSLNSLIDRGELAVDTMIYDDTSNTLVSQHMSQSVVSQETSSVDTSPALSYIPDMK